MAYLVLVRHGKSEWNAKGLWTGWRDIHLNEEGREEARHTGEALKGMHFDLAYTSSLIRAKQTLDEILPFLTPQTSPTIPIIVSPALNERNYGDYTDKNKWDIQKQLGEEAFQKLRRSWDYPIPNGESLKQVYARTVPYYQAEIEPKLKQGKNILISAHGNSLRALVKYLDNIPDDQIASLEIGTGEAYVYQINNKGKVISKEIRAVNKMRGKV